MEKREKKVEDMQIRAREENEQGWVENKTTETELEVSEMEGEKWRGGCIDEGPHCLIRTGIFNLYCMK